MLGSLVFFSAPRPHHLADSVLAFPGCMLLEAEQVQRTTGYIEKFHKATRGASIVQMKLSPLLLTGPPLLVKMEREPCREIEIKQLKEAIRCYLTKCYKILSH